MNSTEKYRKTVNGFIMRAYYRIRRRTEGKSTKRPDLYKGKKLVKREDFYKWARNDKEFLSLFKQWAMNGYDRKLTPSVNRINSDKGYTLDNMEWVTNSMNCSLSSITRYKKKQALVYKILGVNNEKRK